MLVFGIRFAISGRLGKGNQFDMEYRPTEIAARGAQSRAASKWTDSFDSYETSSSQRRFHKNAS